MIKRLAILFALAAAPATAQDREFTLQAPDVLVEAGFMQYLLPRFSLKTSVRITVVYGSADAVIGEAGTPVFRQGEVVWHLAKTDGPHTDAFLDWLQSDIGKRTIEAYAPDGVGLFRTDIAEPDVVEAVQMTGDAVLGEDISLRKCGRCHVVSDANRMKAIGSTPSFALLRTFDDWEGRFLSFFALKPHPAFTQVAGVTDPFPENLPSPIVPIEVTLDEIDAIVAYLATVTPADLGAAIQSQ